MQHFSGDSDLCFDATVFAANASTIRAGSSRFFLMFCARFAARPCTSHAGRHHRLGKGHRRRRDSQCDCDPHQHLTKAQLRIGEIEQRGRLPLSRREGRPLLGGCSGAGFEKWAATGCGAGGPPGTARGRRALTVGAVQQSVQVTGDSVSAIETDSPTISGTFTADDADNLPVNTRASFSGTSAAAFSARCRACRRTAPASRCRARCLTRSDVTVDGVTVKSATGGSFIGDTFPSTESISEIRADGVLANAEYGDPGPDCCHHQGRHEHLHGSGFWYYQRLRVRRHRLYLSNDDHQARACTATRLAAAWAARWLFPISITATTRASSSATYEGWRHPAQETLFESSAQHADEAGRLLEVRRADGEGGNALPV